MSLTTYWRLGDGDSTRVMLRMGDTDARIVAVLHDVLEDTDTNAEDLRALGFSKEIIEAVAALTRAPGESYAGFVLRCRANPLARRVKLADIEDNFNLPRTLLARVIRCVTAAGMILSAAAASHRR